MTTIITALISRASRHAGTSGRRADATQSGRPARPGRRQRAAAWAAWPAAGIMLALMAASAPAAYAATGTAPPAPSPRSSPPPPAAPRSSAPAAPPKKAAGDFSCGFIPIHGPTWMGDLGNCLQSFTLSDMVTPGSHDSLSYSLPGQPSGSIAITQDEDLTQQLNDGMRDFDLRVGWTSGNSGMGYYTKHGILYSPWLELPRALTDIDTWALQPGHEHEVILLSLSIDQGNNGPFPSQDCQDFAATLGTKPGQPGALVTPEEVQARFGTTDPGQVTMGQLWSPPDPDHAARVIINNDQCNDAADPSAGQWTVGFSSVAGQASYYADQCTAEGTDNNQWQSQGIIQMVVPAAITRSTAGGEGTQRSPSHAIRFGHERRDLHALR